uniref:Uncharacterized protein n=1 Tax=Amphimedon queenslandica TaxID=400682 RepID=A0A1X7U197_AMPQE
LEVLHQCWWSSTSSWRSSTSCCLSSTSGWRSSTASWRSSATIDVAALQRQRQLVIWQFCQLNRQICYLPDTIHCVWLVYNQTKVPLSTTCQNDGRNRCPDKMQETGLKREPNRTAFRPRPPTKVPKKGLKAQKHTILAS